MLLDVYPTETIPLAKDTQGVIRVGKTRVTLDTFVAAFREGATAEEMAQQYPTVHLADIYAVIGYYLRHFDEVEGYLRERQQLAERVRRDNETQFPPDGIRERLLARQPHKRGSSAADCDENFNNDIVRGLLRRKPDLDIVRVQDVNLSGVDDPIVLEWAADHNRVLLTHDAATMTHFAYERIRAGFSMPGVFEVSRDVSVGTAIEDILLIAQCSFDGEWEGQVRYLPLR